MLASGAMRESVFGVGVLAALALGLTAASHFGAFAPAPVAAVPAPPMPQAAVAIPAPAPPPAPPPAPDLPTVEVQPLAVHQVPDNEASLPVPKVTLHQLDGSSVAVRAQPMMPTTAPPPPRPAAVGPDRLGGAAQAAGGASLQIAGRTVHLFGVLPPERTDVCAQAGGRAGPCDGTARAVLAARLAGSAAIACTKPPGQLGEPGYVCRDGGGIDLGGFLVAGGLALADRTSSFQYQSAEDAARHARRGLWRYR
jgi:endonuclease YncB( thermonuclease family)